jgi:hypothetical protein
MRHHNSTDIFPISEPTPSRFGQGYIFLTASDADLVTAIRRARLTHGLQVMLKPHVDLTEDPAYWRGDIGRGFTDEQWRDWFRAYSRWVGVV